MNSVKNTSKELNDVLKHVNDVLTIEFPTKTVGLEYVVAAMLDLRQNHVYKILDSCLMTNNIEKLKQIFFEHLMSNTVQQKLNNDLIPYSTDLTEICNVLAEEESNATKTEIIGSEHFLLAMINPKNNHTKMIDIFKNIGIDYDFLFLKCVNKTKDNVQKKKQNLNRMMIPMIPLKSDINTKTIAMDGQNFIENYTIDISKQSQEGKIDNVIGRTNEINQIFKVFSRRKKNNVILVGNGGVGKTSIVYHLANLIEQKNVPENMIGKKIVQLNIASLIAGTFLRGAFEERINGLINEMKNSNKYILFIDDIHTVLKTSAKEKDTDITSMITDVLAGGDIRVIGTTTFKDYRTAIESNTMISRRLQKIVVQPSTKQETIDIIQHNKFYYEEYHNVTYPLDVIEKCVELSERYITDRSLPDSAIDVLDLSGARTCMVNRKPQELINLENEFESLQQVKIQMLNNGEFSEVDELIERENSIKLQMNDIKKEMSKNKEKYNISITIDDIKETISEITSIPIQNITVDERKKLNQINSILKQFVVGQDDAIDKICKALKRNKIGLGNPNKVMFSGLLIGPTGCGKTLVAKKLAEEIFGDKNALVRFDMSEYSEKSSVSKLIGSAPGYVMSDSGGQLTEAIKNKPYCVVLIDELEKANEEVYNLFLQILDEGQLTDNVGQKVNFKNTIILMTSNCGAKNANDFSKGIGFEENQEQNKKNIYEKELKKTFTLEFLNRIDQIVYFNSLTQDNYFNITKLELNKTIEKTKNIGLNVTFDDDVVKFITDSCMKDTNFGARPLIRFIQDNVEDNITDFIIENDDVKDVNLKLVDNKIEVVYRYS